MANYFEKPFFNNAFFDKPFFSAPFFLEPYFEGLGTGGTPIDPTPISVLSSTVVVGQADGIQIQFDREMTSTCDTADHINIIVDGGTSFHPTQVVFHPQDHSILGLTVSTPFVAGQVITWEYTDTGTCHLTELAPPQQELANQTFAVTNELT